MTNRIRVDGKTPTEVLELVHWLKDNGYKQGTDFDFEYHAPKEGFFETNPQPRYTVFTFYNAKDATFFALKWAPK